VEINTTAVDLNGTLDVSGTLTLAGNADFNGDLDVDGTTNLDVVDIDGAVDMASTLTVAGTSYIGDTANANATLGLTINQGAADNQIFALKSSDVSTGITSATIHQDVEVDDFLTISKTSATAGGTVLQSLMEDAAESVNLELAAYGGTADTTKSTSARALVEVYVSETDGSNALANVTANGNVFGVRARVGGANVARWFVDEDGDTWQSGGIIIPAGSGIYLDGGVHTYIAEGTDNRIDFTCNGNLEMYINDSQAYHYGDLGIPATKRLYFDGISNTYITEASGDQINLVTGGSTAMAWTSGQDTVVPATSKIYLDGGGNTYIVEGAADRMDFYTGGNLRLQINAGSVEVASGYDLRVNATDKIYLDGGGNTYIYEHSADIIRFYCGGTENISLQADDILMQGGGKIYWDGGIDTYTTLISNNIIGWYCGDTEAMRLTDGTCTITGDIKIPATNKLYLDGGGDTYIHEAGGNYIEVVAGGTANCRFHATSLEMQGTRNLIVNGTGRVYLDGGSDTYIVESSSNTMDFYTSALAISIDGNQNVSLKATGKLYFDGGNDTYIAETSSDEVRLYVGGSEKLRLNASEVMMPSAYSATSGSAANVYVDSGGKLYRSTSSIEYKQDVEDYELEDAWATIEGLRPITYRQKEGLSVSEGADIPFDHGKRHLGFVAEEVDEVEQLLVKYRLEDGEESPDYVEYSRVVAPLVSVVKDLMARIEALEA